MGTTEEIRERYEYYKERIKDLSKEEKINWLEEVEWNIDMVDRWQREEYICMAAIRKIKEELKGEE